VNGKSMNGTIVLGAPKAGFFGGVEQHVYDLARGLRARGHSVALVHGGGEGREPERFTAPFTMVLRWQDARKFLSRARLAYLHKLDDPALLESIPAAVPLVLAVHDHDRTCVRSHRYLPLSLEPCQRPPGIDCVTRGCVVVRCRESRLGVALRDPFALARSTRDLARRARLVACSQFVRQSLLDAGVPAGRVAVVNPVPPNDPTPLVPAPSAPELGFVGQIIRGKGLDLLLRALVQIPDARLTVAGGGSGLDEARALAEGLGIAPRVDFLGPVSSQTIREVYDRVRVLVVPSRWPEPFGMIGVEAMRRGRVTVGALHGGIPEWLDDGVSGVGFRPGDVGDLARAVRDALSADRYQARAEAALARARSELTFDRMMDRIESVLGLSPNSQPFPSSRLPVQSSPSR
jgi:glycosyltransferase involved in cell wall biosynthesis